MTEAENVHHKMGNGGTRISPSLIYVSEIDFRELKHKTRIFDTRTFSFPTHFPALLSRDFLNSRGTYIYSLLISIVKYMYKRPSLWFLGNEVLDLGLALVVDLGKLQCHL